jgi:hypothetical protein
MEILNSLVIWAQVLGLPIAILAIVVSIWISWRDKQKRSIGCEFQSVEFPLEIKANNDLEGDIKIHYLGKLVENLFITKINLKNIGNQPIRKCHIIEPIKFTFNSDTTLLRLPKIIHKEPENLAISLEIISATSKDKKPATLLLDFDLLNPSDELTIELLCTGKVSFPNISARIEGMTEISTLDIEFVQVRNDFFKWIRAKGVFLISIIAILTTAFIFSDEKIRQAVGILWLIFLGEGIYIIEHYFKRYLNARRQSQSKIKKIETK